MSWYAFYDPSDGRLASVASIIPDPPPAGLSFKTYADRPNMRAVMWDAASRDFTARPPKVFVDRLDDIITHPAWSADLIVLWNALNATNRNRLRNGLIRLLGKARYRAQGERIVIDPVSDTDP